MPDAIEDVSGTTVARLPEQARRLLVAVALKADLEKSDLSSIATSAAIDAAVQAGLLRVDGEQVRASHPLLALAVEQRSCASLRRAVRNALAGRDVTHVEPDPRLRRHATPLSRPLRERSASAWRPSTSPSRHCA